MSHPNYHTMRWRRRARAQIQREPRCEACLRAGRVVAASIADHVVQHHGDDAAFWEGKLQSLCTTCHGEKSRRELTSLQTGKPARPAKGCDASGAPTAPDHPWNRQ